MIFPLSPPMFDLLILSITEKEDSYGYQLSQKIKKVSGVKDSTLYPILKRLQEQGYLSSTAVLEILPDHGIRPAEISGTYGGMAASQGIH